jgi:hypothetical protein
VAAHTPPRAPGHLGAHPRRSGEGCRGPATRPSAEAHLASASAQRSGHGRISEGARPGRVAVGERAGPPACGGGLVPASPRAHGVARRGPKGHQHGVPAHSRPPHPGRNPDHPPKPASAVPLLEAFARDHPSLESTRGLADAVSATPPCMDQARLLFGRPVLSPLRPPHNGRGRPPRSRLEPDVSPAPGVPPRVQSRGGAEVPGTVPRARRAVDAQHTKRVVVALPYAPETDSR